VTYDKQDLLLDLRKLAADDDCEDAHFQADKALLKFVDDEHITAAFITLATGVTR
jgi:hypothetical protein